MADEHAAATPAWARAVLTPRFLVGVTVEAIWQATHLAVYPWGLLDDNDTSRDDYRLDAHRPAARALFVGDVEAAGTPILLVHGLGDNRSTFALMRHALRRRGFHRVLAINYSPTTNDVRAAAARLGQQIETICERTGFDRIHVVGHSLGGLIGRYYVQRLGGDVRVNTLVTLGTPHEGTATAYLLWTGLTKQLRPGSELFEELALPAADCQTRFVSFYSDLDQMVVPQRSGKLRHPDLQVENRVIRGAGHMTLPVHNRVVHEIGAALTHLDGDGDPLADLAVG